MEKNERWDWNRNKSLLSKIFKNCLKAWTERSAVKWKFNYGGFGSDDNPRTLSWLARKLWKQKSSKDICSCSATHLWACCRLWKHGINPCLKKNPQLLTEIQKFCYVNDEKKKILFPDFGIHAMSEKLKFLVLSPLLWDWYSRSDPWKQVTKRFRIWDADFEDMLKSHYLKNAYCIWDINLGKDIKLTCKKAAMPS